MANETTTSTADDGFNAAYINPQLEYAARNQTVIVGLSAQVNLAGKNTKVARWVIPDADTVSDITEGTAMSNTAHSTTNVEVTVAQVGILREITKLAQMTNVVDLEAYLTREDGPAAIAQEMDTDLAATFANASGGVSDTGVNADFSDFIELLALHSIDLGGAQKAFVGHNRQVADIRASVIASNAALFSNPMAGMTDLQRGQNAGKGFAGFLLDIPMYQTTVCPTANGGADRVGALMSVGSAAGGDDREASTGFAYLWLAEVMALPSPANTSTIYGITGCYGCGEKMDRSIKSLTTDA